MNLGYDIANELPVLRDQAISRMTEVFQFYTTVTVTDPETLEDVTTETVSDTTIGRVKFPTGQPQDVESAGQFPVVQRVEVHVPLYAYSAVFSSPWLLPGFILPAAFASVGQLVRCVDSSADASLIGRVFRVAGAPPGGQVTARRYPVTEVS